MTKSLEELRKEIDTLDSELVSIIAKRMDIVREIGKLKKEKNITPLDENRWQEVLEQIEVLSAKYNLSDDLIRKIYSEIHNEALKIEESNE